MDPIHFDLRLVPAGTGPSVWDDPNAVRIVQRFMPQDRLHGPMLGILHLGATRPTPGVLRDVIVTVGEDVRAGRYGSFTLVVSSEDSATRSVITDMATAQGLGFYISSSPTDLEGAEAVGGITQKERETLKLVMQAGGTVTAAELAANENIEQTTAGNRLIALHKKGYLQRIERPHPVGDQFVDPRSVKLEVARIDTQK